MSNTESVELLPRRAAGAWQVQLSAGSFSRVASLPPGDTLLVGAASRAHLRLQLPGIAEEHLRLRATSAGLVLEALGDVWIGPVQVRRVSLTESMDKIRVGPAVLGVSEPSSSPPERSELVDSLIGSSASMVRLRQDIQRLAPLNRPVLIQGESGSGKDVVARALHQLSGRKGPFVALNVGGISEALADSELFGHTRGAFTGAQTARLGAFRKASGGTLFLDEVADVAPAIQIKLLRAIEEGVVTPLGSEQPHRLDVRVVSACWARLRERVKQGSFREDLFHRISTVSLEVPPLRRRLGDIPELGEKWLYRYRAELGEHVLDTEALEMLADYHWPGNVRELGSVLYRAAVFAGDQKFITRPLLANALPERRSVRKCSGAEDVLRLLDAHGGNTSAAARSAGVPRSTFRLWVSKARFAQANAMAVAAQATAAGA